MLFESKRKKEEKKHYEEYQREFLKNWEKQINEDPDEIKKYVELYKDDEDILRLGKEFFDRVSYSSKYELYKNCGIHNSNEFREPDGKIVVGKDYFFYDFTGINGILNFKQNGIAIIEKNKLVAVITDIFDYYIQHANELAATYDLQYIFELNRVYRIRFTSFDDNYTCGIVGDDLYNKIQAVKRDDYLNISEFDRNRYKKCSITESSGVILKICYIGEPKTIRVL